MIRSFLTTLAAAAVLAGSARAGEDAAAELDRLSREVAELRREVMRLSAALAEGPELGDKLLAISRKLAAGKKLAEGSEELAVLYRALTREDRPGLGVLAARALGLARLLPPEQRAGLLGKALCDLSVQDMTRARILDELAMLGDEPARRAIGRAAELEIQLPQATAGHMGAGSYFLGRLAEKLGGFKDKLGVDLMVSVIDSRFRAPARPDWGVSLYGEELKCAEKLGAWSGQEAWSEVLKKRGRGNLVQIKGQEDLEAARAAFEKVKAWWKDNREKFEFPEEAPKPPGPAPVVEILPAPEPGGPAQPPRRPDAPEVF